MSDADGFSPSEPEPTPLGDDAILPFELERAGIRGRLVRLDRTLETILTQHRYPDAVSALVSEAALLTAMIGQAIKLRWRFSLQIRGSGPVKLIATDYFAPEAEGAPARMRAYASFERGDVASSRATGLALLGQGVFGVTIDQGPDMRPYQGITPLTGERLADCAEVYFAQSEQLATRFRSLAAKAQTPGAAAHWRGGGLMLQQLPEALSGAQPDAPSGAEGLMTADDVAAMGAREEDWSRANLLADTVEEHELIGPHVSPERLLTRLFHEESPRVYPVQAVRFGCTCSAERVEAALAQYSDRDIAHMTTPEGTVTADCQFCSAHYTFDPAMLGFEAAARRKKG
ncbi:MAG: Hsp33 family molecular chaperone HslO [Pseudomonadota bacterium]